MFYKILKAERMKKGLSQLAFAKILGISQQTIGSWETGRTSPDLETLIKIASFFNVSTDYLLGVTDVPTKNNVQSNLIKLSDEELQLIKKYRELPLKAQKKIKFNIDIEHDDVINLEKTKTKSDMKEIS
ncbi:helix-turn-helix domain-containing protein [Megamonas funiformis]|uniref:helix-turn-helix domain-containing protein n=2 Tax=Megamonas funiformis TaxID=437897 RepID=UPI0021FAC87C|nr:helix-turn-helix transcriptional regulator [Megamonas funiformis]UVX48498.1 MAG: helix-turn-helix domain protein [Bacteriophage sp.]